MIYPSSACGSVLRCIPTTWMAPRLMPSTTPRGARAGSTAATGSTSGHSVLRSAWRLTTLVELSGWNG